MIGLLPNFNIKDTLPTYDDRESVTLLNHAGVLHSKVNEVIKNFNDLEINLTKVIAQYQLEANQERLEFETALRQEFQDFIDIVDMKISNISGDTIDLMALLGEEY